MTPTIEAVYKSYESASESNRPHLGASEIGKPCGRALWYGFRHASKRAFSGRMLRLFERGQREEPVLIKNLRDIGVTVWDVDPSTGKQFGFATFGGHFSGSCDGVGRGFPEDPRTPMVLEFKTSSDKLFQVLVRDGVEKAKPEHWAQMQVYMSALDINRAYYLAVNKDTDDIYGEIVHFSPVHARQLFEKAERIIFAEDPPGKISDDPAFWQCKFCDHWAVCHGEKLPEINCRTCTWSSPKREGGWSCPIESEMKPGCTSHIFHPVFFTKSKPAHFDSGTLTLEDGTTVGNGGVTSEQLRLDWNAPKTPIEVLAEVIPKKVWQK